MFANWWNKSGVMNNLIIPVSESKNVPSPPIYGCLMITIDCNAKEREGGGGGNSS